MNDNNQIIITKENNALILVRPLKQLILCAQCLQERIEKADKLSLEDVKNEVTDLNYFLGKLKLNYDNL